MEVIHSAYTINGDYCLDILPASKSLDASELD